jgi:hypothetical protein
MFILIAVVGELNVHTYSLPFV